MSSKSPHATRPPANKAHPFSLRVYGWLLLVYPAKFRREYGPQMAQLFRDCYRLEKTRGSCFGVSQLWLRTLLDMAGTAPKQHLENLGKENPTMNNLRRDAVALLGCIGIIGLSIGLLPYVISQEVSFIRPFGYALDALISAGIPGNLIVFVLVKTTRLNPLRSAFWTFLIVHSALFGLAALIGSSIEPQFALGGVLLGYVMSFLFWFGVHWTWAKSRGQWAIGSEQ